MIWRVAGCRREIVMATPVGTRERPVLIELVVSVKSAVRPRWLSNLTEFWFPPTLLRSF